MKHNASLLRPIFCAFFALLLLAPSGASARGLIRDAEIEHHLRLMMDPILRAANIDPRSVRLFIVDDPSINAFVAGENNMFLHTGLLTTVTNADMLLGVIAHEVGHIAGGHLALGAEQLQRAQIGVILSYILGAAAAAAGSGDAAIGVMSAGQNVAERGLLSFTRSHEQYADQAALGYLETVNIPANGMLDMFELLRREESLSISGNIDPYALTHPLSKERMAHIRGYIQGRHTTKTSATSKFAPSLALIQAKLEGFMERPTEVLAKPISTPPTAMERYRRAIALYRLPDLQAALKDIDMLLDKNDNNAYLHELKGQILFENGKIEASAKSYQKAVTLAPKEALLQTSYGQSLLSLYRQTKDEAALKQSIASLEFSAQEDDSMALTWHLLTEAYGHAGKRGHMFLAQAEKFALQNDMEEAKTQAIKAIETFNEEKHNGPALQRARDLLIATEQAIAKEDS